MKERVTRRRVVLAKHVAVHRRGRVGDLQKYKRGGEVRYYWGKGECTAERWVAG